MTIEIEVANSLVGPWDVIAASVAGGVTTGPGYFSGENGGEGVKTVVVRDIVAPTDPLRLERFLRIRVTR